MDRMFSQPSLAFDTARQDGTLGRSNSPHRSEPLAPPDMASDFTQRSQQESRHGGSPANTLTASALDRCTLQCRTPVRYRGGLPGYRLKRVLDYINDNLSENLSLARLAAVAAMSPHYFAALFKQSTGTAPHRYVLLQRIEHAKQSLRDSRCSVIGAGLDSGFQNPSHFARMFRKFVGISPSEFQADLHESSQPEKMRQPIVGRSAQLRSFGGASSRLRE